MPMMEMPLPPMQVAQVVIERPVAGAGKRGLSPNRNTLTISHEPVASLNWPRMTMEFVPANAGLVGSLKPGAKIRFEFVERGQGEWVVTKLEAK